MKTGVTTLLFFLWVTYVWAGQPCNIVTWCIEGEKCDGDRCIPCEDGTFQAEHTHKEIYCHEWTKKPPGPFWEVKQRGSAENDVVWGCREGTIVIYSTPEETFCVEPTDRAPTPVVTVPPSKQSNVTTTSTTVGAPEPDSGESSSSNDWATIVSIAIAVTLVILIMLSVMICIFVRYKKHRIKYVEKLLVAANGGEADTTTEQKDPVENSLQSQNARKLAKYLGHEIEQTQFEQFFFGIKSCQTYNPHIQLTYNKDKFRGGLEAYLVTFTEWWNVNVQDNEPSKLISWITNELEMMKIYSVVSNPKYEKLCNQLSQDDTLEIVIQIENTGDNDTKPEEEGENDTGAETDSLVPPSAEHCAVRPTAPPRADVNHVAHDSEDELDSSFALNRNVSPNENNCSHIRVYGQREIHSERRPNGDDDVIDALRPERYEDETTVKKSFAEDEETKLMKRFSCDEETTLKKTLVEQDETILQKS